jgi:iron complex transport system substrate-binding protein
MLVANLLAACTGEPETEADGTRTSGTASVVTDAAGIEHPVSASPQRIVSLVPSATETLLALGQHARLVARTDYDVIDELAALPSVGGGLQPNLEAILAADPDLVIYFLGESDESTPRRLAEAGVGVFAVRPDGVDDVRAQIRALGALTGARPEADAMLAAMDGALAEIRDRIGDRAPVRTVFTLGGEAPWVAGPGTYVDELIRAAGGENVFSDLGELYAPVSAEEFLSREIDVVLVTPGTAMPERMLTGVLHEVPAFVQLPGPRLAEAAAAIARILHPEAFR